MYKNIKIVIIPKQYTGINQYRNISFLCPNLNGFLEIDSLDYKKHIPKSPYLNLNN